MKITCCSTITKTPTKIFRNEQCFNIPKRIGFGGYVYIFATDIKMKIGKTTNWEQRKNTISYNSGIPHFNTQIVTIEHSNYSQNECILMNHFKDYRIHGEWFTSTQLETAVDLLMSLDMNIDEDLNINESNQKLGEELRNLILLSHKESEFEKYKSILFSVKSWLDQGDLWEFQKQLIRDKGYRFLLNEIVKKWKNYVLELYGNKFTDSSETTFGLYLTETIIRFKQLNDIEGFNKYLYEGEVPTFLWNDINVLYDSITIEMESSYDLYIKDINCLINNLMKNFKI